MNLNLNLNMFLQECRSKWEEKRTEICCPVDDGKKRKYEKCDLNSYRKEENFTSIFQKGKAEPVTDFLVSQGFDVKQLGDEAKQIQFVQNEPWLHRRVNHHVLLRSKEPAKSQVSIYCKSIYQLELQATGQLVWRAGYLSSVWGCQFQFAIFF